MLFGELNSFHASQVFTEARIELALSRRMSARTMTFLDDAHKRGVLRRSGAVYELRHIRLQRRLARPRITLAVFVAGVALEAFDVCSSSLASGSVSVSNRWLPSSARPIYWRVWARRFREARAALPRELELVAPADVMHWAGPGLAQRHRSVDGGYWILCALPSGMPVLVAGDVWDGIRDLGSKMTIDDALAAFGLPYLGKSVQASKRVIGPDATDVVLADGSWGIGRLVRDGAGSEWRGCVDSGVAGYSLVRTPWSATNIGRRPLRIVATATVPWHGLQPSIATQASIGLGAGLGDGALFQAGVALLATLGVDRVPGDWRSTNRKSSSDSARVRFEIASPRRWQALTAEATLSLQDNDRVRSRKASPKITAEVRVDIYDAWPTALAAVQEGPDDGKSQKFLNQLVALCVAAWETAANALMVGAEIPSANIIPASFKLKLTVPRRFDAVTHRGSKTDQFISDLGFDAYEASVAAWGPLEMSREERRSYTQEGIADISRWLGLIVPREWKRSHP
jgi:hypothetical protein